jgi:hypothetical protein
LEIFAQISAVYAEKNYNKINFQEKRHFLQKMSENCQK